MASPGTKGRGENGLLLDLAVAGREQRDGRVALRMGAPHQSQGKTGGETDLSVLLVTKAGLRLPDPRKIWQLKTKKILFQNCAERSQTHVFSAKQNTGEGNPPTGQPQTLPATVWLIRAS